MSTRTYPDQATDFIQWVTGYAFGAGDPPIAVQRLHVLHHVLEQLQAAISELEGEVISLGRGTHETPYGAVTVHKGAARYLYPLVGSDDHRAFFEKICHSRPTGEPIADFLYQLFNLGPQSVRSSKLMELTGLRISDYREAMGHATTVQLH